MNELWLRIRLARTAAGALWLCCAGASAAVGQTDGETGDADRRPADLGYVVVDGVSIQDPLSDSPGDAERGRAIFVDEAQGGCAGCHRVGGEGGDAGPALDDVGSRLSDGAIRLWIVNPAAVADAPGMPAYFTLAPQRRGDAPRDAPRLSGQAIEDLVAYLDGLTRPPPSASGE